MELQNQCLVYIIAHLDEFTPSSLALLSTWIHCLLLVNLPAVDICQLERTEVVHGIDMCRNVWRNVCFQCLPVRVRMKLECLTGPLRAMEVSYANSGVTKMKRQMLVSLQTRYSNENKFYALATLLDPRFKQRVFSSATLAALANLRLWSSIPNCSTARKKFCKFRLFCGCKILGRSTYSPLLDAPTYPVKKCRSGYCMAARRMLFPSPTTALTALSIRSHWVHCSMKSMSNSES